MLEGIDPKQVGSLLNLGQVGLEMVAPIGLGWFLDFQFGLSPWCVAAGAVLGFVGGLAHLMVLLGRPKKSDNEDKRRDSK